MLLISKYGNGSEEFVNGLERKLGIELDEEYRKFLVKYNGGDKLWEKYPQYREMTTFATLEEILEEH